MSRKLTSIGSPLRDWSSVSFKKSPFPCTWARTWAAILSMSHFLWAVDATHASLGWNLGGMERWPHLTMQRAYHIELPTEKYQNKKNCVANSSDIWISDYPEKWWLFLRLYFVSSTCKTLYFKKNSIDFQKICEVWKDFFLSLKLEPTTSY